MKTIRIGNAAGFWGDSPSAPRRLVQNGQLDYLTLEYLAELTLSILAHQKKKNPTLGFVTEVPTVVSEIASHFSADQNLKLVTNGGGMNPSECAKAVAQVLNDEREMELGETLIATSCGDDIFPRLDELIATGEQLVNIETGEAISSIRDRIASANVYLGSEGICESLAGGARVVLTGRVADASLIVGPAIHEFGWGRDDYPKLAKATVAGHLIECGAQATGGIYSDWNPEMSLGDIGYPIAVMNESGDCEITKPDGTGGEVSVGTCSEQLVYEIGDPKRYMTPDVIADFSQVKFGQSSKHVVSVTGGMGASRPDQLKVSIAYYDGFIASGMIVVAGRHAAEKATAAARAIQQKLVSDGIELDDFNIELLGMGDSAPGMQSKLSENSVSENTPWEVVLRVTGRSQNRNHTDRMLRELAPLVTSGPPGVTGYTGARGKSMPVLSFWPALISREHVQPKVKIRSAADWLLNP